MELFRNIPASGPKNENFEKIKQLTPIYQLNLQVHQILKEFYAFLSRQFSPKVKNTQNAHRPTNILFQLELRTKNIKNTECKLLSKMALILK